MKANYVHLTHDSDKMFSMLNCLITIAQKPLDIKVKEKTANSAVSAHCTSRMSSH